MNHTLIVPEFDPELQPIGYALALEFLGEGGYADSPEERVLTTSAHDGRPSRGGPLILGDGTALPARRAQRPCPGVVEAADI